MNCFAVIDPGTSRSLINSVAASVFPSDCCNKDNNPKRPKNVLAKTYYHSSWRSVVVTIDINREIPEQSRTECNLLERMSKGINQVKKVYILISTLFQKRNVEFDKPKKIVRKQYAQVESWRLCWIRFAIRRKWSSLRVTTRTNEEPWRRENFRSTRSRSKSWYSTVNSRRTIHPLITASNPWVEPCQKETASSSAGPACKFPESVLFARRSTRWIWRTGYKRSWRILYQNKCF